MAFRVKSGLIPLCIAVFFFLAGVVSASDTSDVRYEARSVRAGGRVYRCNVVTINLASGRIVPRLVTASSGIGRTEEFAAMVQRTQAVAAINGSFFEAYLPVGDKDPDMTLIRNGQVIHKGALGSVAGFTSRGALIGRLDLPIRGTVKWRERRYPANWYAYWINRTPTAPNNIAIFTPARGARARVKDGTSVVVSHNVVTGIVQGDAAIPPLGYVINFRGSEAAQSAKFKVGALVGYRVVIVADRNSPAWQTVSEGVGAGPRLLTDGQVTLDPMREGFHDPKILANAGLRSAIGVLRDGKVILVTVSGATIRELADVMRALGAVQAMNLDGGASSGLYAKGRMITPAGRPLSNALAFVRP